MIVAYLTSIYPRASDTFIRNEVLGLRERGHTVLTYSVRRPDADQLVSDEIRSEHVGTTYILPKNGFKALLTTGKLLVTQPRKTFGALILALRTGSKGIKSRIWQLAYFVEAAFLADHMRAAGVQHLHNHLGERSATVAMLTSAISDIPFSNAIHGPYIFRAPLEWALGEKVARAAFTACITDFTKSQCMIYAPREHWHKLKLVRCTPGRAFLEVEPAPLPEAKRMVWVGRVCEEKGVPILIEAASCLAAEGLDFELVLLGDGPMREEVEASLAKWGLKGKVKLTGWASSEVVRQAMLEARFVVMPSFAEGLPVVLMEALALGRPVISTYIAGIPELIENGVDGWIVPAGSLDALTDAMREALLASTDELERLGRAGRERVLERHDWRTEVRELEGYIESSVRGRA